MPPLGPSEQYLSLESLNNYDPKIFEIEAKSFAISLRMGGLMLRVRELSGVRDAGLVRSFLTRNKIVTSPVVHYPVEGLGGDEAMSAWIQEGRNFASDETLFTQAVSLDGDGRYTPVADPEPRVTANSAGDHPLHHIGVDESLMTTDQRLKLVNDVAEVIDMLSVATYPGLETDGNWTPIAKS